MKVVLCNATRFSGWCMPASFADAVRARFPELDVVHVTDRALLAAAMERADLFSGSSLTRDELARAGQLRYLHSTATGVDLFPLADIAARRIPMTNARTVHAPPMAEHAVALVLALLRRLHIARDHQRARRWAQEEIWSEHPPATLAGRTVLLVGLGAVGQEVARRLAPFGATLHAVTRSGRADGELVSRCARPEELVPALAVADVVVLAAPATTATVHMIGAPQLQAMKAGALLVNLARGSLVDEAALAAALAGGRIAGAALDVTATEPLPAESPLWAQPELLLTPHLSAMSPNIWSKQAELLVDNLARLLEGRELRNPVDVARGY